MSNSEIGRIVFAGNPWPSGHRIVDFVWSARLDPEEGVYFDLHLVSAEYNAEGKGEERTDAWCSPGTWNNYHRCTLSSVKWADQMDGTPGFLAGTAEEPLSFAALPGRTFAVDPHEEGSDVAEELSFGVYLLGHDSAADHCIRFGAWAADGSIDIRWTGLIALTYAGSTALDHRFEADIHRARFEGIFVPGEVGAKDAWTTIRRFVTDVDRLKLMRGKKSGARRFVLRD